jgi:hypothetical protein
MNVSGAQDNGNGAGTYTIVHGLQDHVIEVASSIRVSDRNGKSKALEHVLCVSDVDDQEFGTLVAD